LASNQLCGDKYKSSGLTCPEKRPFFNILLEGEIYQETFTDGKILRRHKTTPQQDRAWLNYIMTKRLGTKDGYSVARHNCRKYSNMEFDDAPKHYGP